MNKYDFGYVIHPGTTTQIAFDTVEKESEVLEIGCSNGNLTMHLAEDKHCAVDIIEINTEAGTQASQFSRSALIGPKDGDLEGAICWEKVKKRKYDYIIGLDVLEHLRNPQSVLQQLKGLLKEDGSLIISVPNMAHNSVLIDLIQNRLQYNELGILDKTHLRFFTEQTLNHLADECGLIPVKKQVIQIPVGSNEIQNQYADLSPEWSVLLKKRPLAEVFQFVYILKKHGEAATLVYNSLDTTRRLIKLYYRDSEDVFSEKQMLFQYLLDTEHAASFSIEQKKLSKIRIDFSDQDIVLEDLHIHITSDGDCTEIDTFETNGEKIENGCYCFSKKNPEILFDVSHYGRVKKVTISFTPVLNGQKQISRLEEYIVHRKGYIQFLEDRVKDIQSELKESCNSYTEIRKDVEDLRTHYAEIVKSKDEELTELKKSIHEYIEKDSALANQLAMRQDEVTGLKQAVHEYTVKNAELENCLAMRQDEAAELKKKTQEQDSKNIELKRQLDTVQCKYNAVINSFFWKLTKPFRWIVDSLRSMCQ